MGMCTPRTLLAEGGQPISTAASVAVIRLPASVNSWAAGLFENHWFLWATLLLVAAALAWRGWDQANRRWLGAGAIIAALTALWFLIAALVVTPRERLIAANQAVVRAAANDNPAGILHFLAPTAVVGTWPRNRAGPEISIRLDAAHISSNFIRTLRVRIHGRRARVLLVVWTQTRDMGPFVTAWRILWRDHPRPGNWRIVQLDLLSVNSHALPPGASIPMVPW